MGLQPREKWAVAAALAAAALLGSVWLYPRWTAGRAGAAAEARQAASAALLRGRWREAATQDAGAPDAGAKFAAALTTELRDPDHVLTPEQRGLLIETLTRYLRARSAASAREYLALSEPEPGVRWIGPEDAKEWARIDDWFKFRFHAAPDRADPKGALLRMIEATSASDRPRVLGFGLGQRGLVSAAYRVRSSDQREVQGRFIDIVEPMGDELYWLEAPTVSAMRMRVPVRALERVIEEEGGAVVAGSMVAIATEGGVTFCWYCIWYWDERSRSWQCDQMQRKGQPGPLY